MVAFGTLLLVVCFTCMQHTGALKLNDDSSEESSEEEDGGLQARGLPTPPSIWCDLEWNGDKLPVIVREDNHAIVQPRSLNGKKIIRILADEGVIISCERKSFKKSALGRAPKLSGIAAVRAYCKAANNKLVVDLQRNDPLSMFLNPLSRTHGVNPIIETNAIEDIRCNGNFQATAIATTERGQGNKITTKTCSGGRGGEYKIVTFNTVTKVFFSQIEVCFDKTHETTLWAKHTLIGGNFVKTSGKGSWKEDRGLFTSIMGPKYTNINKQVSKANVALKSLTDLLKRDVAPPQTKIAKGHLSPNADFHTEGQRKATFNYINAVPQFQADNNGNWVHIVEESVRNLAKKRSDLSIISGGYGTLHLKNIKGKDVAIYLDPSNSRTDAKGVPIPNRTPFPKFMWKIVTNEAKSVGVAFVTCNDPFIGNPLSTPSPDVLCKDVCGLLDTSWFKGNNREDPTKGYTYCCRVDELKKKILTIPEEYANIKNLLVV